MVVIDPENMQHILSHLAQARRDVRKIRGTVKQVENTMSRTIANLALRVMRLEERNKKPWYRRIFLRVP